MNFKAKLTICFRNTAIVFSLLLCTHLMFAQSYQPGVAYFGSTGYVEYIAGNLPIVISVPHGGYLQPSTIPDRSCTGCVYGQDLQTQEVGRGLIDAFFAETGSYPHVVFNLLHRIKFDANRDVDVAADGNATVEEAWNNYHAFIDSAKAQIEEDYGRGLFFDLHGHGHEIQRIELGYLLAGWKLRESDTTMNTVLRIEQSSIRTLVGDDLLSESHAELIRGPHSLGTLLDAKGFPSVPSLSDPHPDEGEDYFSGGYNTVRHGSRDNVGNIDGIQIECNKDIRTDPIRRLELISDLTSAITEYVELHYHSDSTVVSIDFDYSKNKIGFLYPNPSKSGLVNLDVSFENEKLVCTVFDIAGNKLMRQSDQIETDENKIILDFSTIQKGIYIVKIDTRMGPVFRKLVIN